MPEVARKDSTEQVQSPDGSGVGCPNPTMTSTDVGSGDVFANGIGIVREGDAVKSHIGPGCVPHAPTLSSFSGTVFINGKGCGRKGDDYSNHVILTGSSDVFAGG